jgi:hypothetical protein
MRAYAREGGKSTMARRDRYRRRGIYQPTTPRRPYGRRLWRRNGWTPHPLDTELEDAGIAVLSARALMVAGGEGAERLHFVGIPMPRGAMRWHVHCPRCGTVAAQLYDVSGWGDAVRSLICRRCLGLRYASQYTLRRAEADGERVAELARHARKTQDPCARRRRLARVRALRDTRDNRASRIDRRKGQAEAIVMLSALLRSDARSHRMRIPVMHAIAGEDMAAVREMALAIEAERAEQWQFDRERLDEMREAYRATTASRP